jgi:DNA-binding NtrC family response regulator
VRIIAASNVELKDAVADGKFREDLYFRLSVIPVHVPALREHKEDIPLLVSHFLNIFNQQLSRKVKNFSPSAMNAMMEYQWPGNVRELENLIERLVVLSKSPTVGKEMLPTEIAKIGTPEKPMASGKRSDRVETLSYKDALRKFEASFIKKAVDAAGGNKSEAARRMGIHRNTLINKSKDEEPRAND